MSAAVVFKKDEQSNSAELVLSGEWLLEAHLDNRADVLGKFADPGFKHVTLNGREITCPPSEMFIRIKEDIFGKINFWRQ